jgi:transketolase
MQTSPEVCPQLEMYAVARRAPLVVGETEAAELMERARLRLLEMHYHSKVGHIGGNLSALDILMSLYHFRLGPDDGFVLSKGHAAGALYVTLWTMGLLTDEDLRHFHGEGTRLSGHPPLKGVPEVIFATGSLGHGLRAPAGKHSSSWLIKSSTTSPFLSI